MKVTLEIDFHYLFGVLIDQYDVGTYENTTECPRDDVTFRFLLQVHVFSGYEYSCGMSNSVLQLNVLESVYTYTRGDSFNVKK